MFDLVYRYTGAEYPYGDAAYWNTAAQIRAPILQHLSINESLPALCYRNGDDAFESVVEAMNIENYLNLASAEYVSGDHAVIDGFADADVEIESFGHVIEEIIISEVVNVTISHFFERPKTRTHFAIHSQNLIIPGDARFDLLRLSPLGLLPRFLQEADLTEAHTDALYSLRSAIASLLEDEAKDVDSALPSRSPNGRFVSRRAS